MDEPTITPHDPRYLRALLHELHSELERSDVLSEEERALLTHVKTDVDGALERAETGGERDESLGERLEEGIVAFEATHPELAMAMQRVLDSLTQTGV